MHRTCMRPLVFTAFLSDSFSLLDSSSVLLPRISFDAPISRVARARDFTTSQKVLSFSRAAKCLISRRRSFCRVIWLSSWNSSAISWNARSHFLISPSKTYVAFESQQHLSQLAPWSHQIGSFHLIFRNISTVCIMIYIRAYTTAIRDLQLFGSQHVRWKSFGVSRSLAAFRKFIYKRESWPFYSYFIFFFL